MLLALFRLWSQFHCGYDSLCQFALARLKSVQESRSVGPCQKGSHGMIFCSEFLTWCDATKYLKVSIWNLEFQRIFHWEFQKNLILKYARNKKVQSYEIKTLKTKNQRRAHSLSGCANLDSTPLLLGGTGVYCPPQSHYCSWSWNWVYLFRCGLGWNPLRSTPFRVFIILQV